MKLVVNKDRTVYPVGTWGTKNENDYEVLEFEFPEELEEYNKRIVYYLDDERVWDIITDNKAYITNAITQYKKVKAYVWLTKENAERENDTDFRTKLFEMKFFENENADGIIPTEEQVDGFNTMITQMNEKIEEIDDKMVEIYDKIDDIDAAIDRTNNLDIDVSDKVDGDVTITLTKKDDTTKTVVLSDGTSLMFRWVGTSLGIKTDEDTTYTYVDLQGIQGPAGPKGEAFVIKKTYPSVAAMNADFDNMQLGDYVMIASDVEIEDNAKLYTKGEQAWIFITDFSGATGIKGEDGTTPNIQIGTVTSGSAPAVTRSGTNENPVFNFVLEAGYTPVKGTDYFTNAEITEFTNTITDNVNQNIGLVVDAINGEVI